MINGANQCKPKWHVALMEPRAARLSQGAEGEWGSAPARALRARGYEVYYPAFPQKVNKSYNVIKLVMRPMFPGYMFVNQSLKGWEALRTTPGMRAVNTLLMVDGHLAVLPDGEIDRIAAKERELLSRAISPQTVLPYEVGDTVRIVDGPWQGFYGEIENLDDSGRITLLMDIFRRKARVFTSHKHLSAI